MLLSDLQLSEIRIQSPKMDLQDQVQWLQNILPDIPSIVDDMKEEISFKYKSSFCNTFLIVVLSYKNTENGFCGEIVIKTDNYSVLTIMKVSNFSPFNTYILLL